MSYITSFPANTTIVTSNVTTGNFTATGTNVTLGSNSSVRITGGSTGQILATDGSGNLTWTTQGANQAATFQQLGFTFTGQTANGTGTTGAQSEIVDYTLTANYAPNAGGITWNSSATSITSLPSPGSIKYLNDRWVAVSGQTKATLTVYTSTDGYTWTTWTALRSDANIGTYASLTGIAYGVLPGGQNGWMAIVYDGSNKKAWAAYTTDFTTWTLTDIGLPSWTYTWTSAVTLGADLVYDSGTSQWIGFFVYSTSSSTNLDIRAATSTNGSSWSVRSPIFSYSGQSLPFQPMVQLVVGTGGVVVACYGGNVNLAGVVRSTTGNLGSWSLVGSGTGSTGTASLTFQNGYFVVSTSAGTSYSSDGTTWTNTGTFSSIYGITFVSQANVWVFGGSSGVYSITPFSNGAPNTSSSSLLTSTAQTQYRLWVNNNGNGFATATTSGGIQQWQYGITQSRYNITLPGYTSNGVVTPAQTVTFTPAVGGNLTTWVGNLANTILAARPSYTVSYPQSGGSNNVLRLNSNANVDFGTYSNANITLVGATPTGNFSVAVNQVGSSGITGVRDTVVFTDPQTGSTWSFQPSFNDTLQTVANISAAYNTIPAWVASLPPNVSVNPNLTYYTSKTPGAINSAYNVTCSVLRGSNSTLTVNGSNSGGTTGSYSNAAGNVLVTGINSVNYIVSGNSNVRIANSNGPILMGANGYTVGNINESTVSIGANAGLANTGSNSVYIGVGAGANGGSFANVIVLNSTGSNLNPTVANATYINSVRNEPNALAISNVANVGIVTYDTTTKELRQGAPVFTYALENITTNATAPTGTINFDLLSNAIVYNTTAATGNVTLNFRGNSTVAANTILGTTQSITGTYIMTTTATGYAVTAVQVDGVAQTIKWAGGTAASAQTNATTAHVFTIIKTGSATYTVLGAQTKYA